MKKSKTLVLGSGPDKVKNGIGIDINPRSKADLIHDLNKVPYPFKKDTFDLIIAENILEHLDDIPRVLEEIHRISKNGAVFVIKGPHYTSVDSFTDPTHKHFFTSRTFDYFIPGEDLYKYKYSKFTFKKTSVRIGPERVKNPLLRVILGLINKNVIFYEKHLSYLFPVGVIEYKLKVTKKR